MWQVISNNTISLFANNSNYSTALFVCFFTVLVTACSSNRSIVNPTNTVQYYSSGLPYFSIGAIGNYDERNNPEVKVYLKVPYSNLIFKHNPSNGTFDANFQIKLDLFKVEETKNKEISKAFIKSVHADDYNQTQSYQQYQFDYLFDVEPGNYELVAEISDRNTDKSTRKILQLTIPEVKQNSFIVSDIQLMSKDAKKLNQSAEVSYNISPDYDSLKADIQLVLPSSKKNLSVRMNLLKLKSDTLAASLPYGVSPGRSSLKYKGIDYTQADTIQSSLRRLSGISGLITIDFPLPNLVVGNYKTEIIAYGPESEVMFKKNREFAIKQPNYPEVNQLDQMVQALKYIAYPDEYEQLLKIESTQKLRVAFETFWLKLYESEPRARGAINSYYSRVERANELFPSYKEGWKTDLGMIYIVMGEPVYTEENGDELIWYYPSNNPQNGGTIFFLFKNVAKSDSRPYEHYVLQRGMGYQWLFQSAVESWRNGGGRTN